MQSKLPVFNSQSQWCYTQEWSSCYKAVAATTG